MVRQSGGRLILNCEQCRAVDAFAIQRLGIPGVVLMENAGRQVADWVRRLLLKCRGSRATVLCGRGNNGGDGFVVARHLLRMGYDVSVELAGDPAALSPDAAVNYAALTRLGVPVLPLPADGAVPAEAVRRWQAGEVLVDALLGTGFTGEVRQPLRGIIEAVNGLVRTRIVAVDVPSGLNADTGEPGGVAVRAGWTMTFVALKPGLVGKHMHPWVGWLKVADIGIPAELVLRRMAEDRTI